MAALALPLVTAGLSALTGIFGNKKKVNTTTQNTQTDNNTNFNNTSTNGFNLSPTQQSMLQEIFSKTQGDNAVSLEGYKANGLKDINDSSDVSEKAISNLAASRGLSFSPAGFNPQAQAENSRISQQNTFLNTLPMVKNQLDQQSFQNLLAGFAATPKETFNQSSGIGGSWGNSSSTGTSTDPGNPVGGGILGGLSGLLQPTTPGGGTSGLGSILGSIFGNKSPAPWDESMGTDG